MKRVHAVALWMAGTSVAAFAAFAAGAVATSPHVHIPTLSSLCSTFQREMDQGMARMMDSMHRAGYTDNVDADFLAMMIPHHAGAVDMARLVLQHGADPATRQLAEEIIASQTVEIQSMERRLALLRQAGGAGDEFPALGGTRGP